MLLWATLSPTSEKKRERNNKQPHLLVVKNNIQQDHFPDVKDEGIRNCTDTVCKVRLLSEGL